jgi:hypothetical protein
MGCLSSENLKGGAATSTIESGRGSVKNGRFSAHSSVSAPHTTLRRPLTKL